MIEELHHVQIAMPAKKEDEARGFYCDVLNFSEVSKPRELRSRGGVWLETGNVRLHIGVEKAFKPAKKAHPGFRVTSLKDIITHLETAGVEYRTDIDLPKMKRIYVNDPFGNRIELLELNPV